MAVKRIALLTLALSALLCGTAAAGVIQADLKLIGAGSDALGRVLAAGDLDGDGRLDLFVSGCGP